MKKTKTRWSIAAQLLTKLLKRSLTERILNGPIRDSFCLFSFFSLSNDKILDQVQLCKLKSVDVVRGIRTRGRGKMLSHCAMRGAQLKVFFATSSIHICFRPLLLLCCCSKSFTTFLRIFSGYLYQACESEHGLLLKLVSSRHVIRSSMANLINNLRS